MRARILARLAWVLCALTGALLVGLSLLLVPVHAALPDTLPIRLRLVDDVSSGLSQLAFATLGAFIVTRRPERRLGWLFCAIGLVGAADGLAGNYALYALQVAPGALPGGLAAGWVQNWLWMVGLGLLFFLPLLFPTGQLLSARWRVVVWLALGALALRWPLQAFQPGPLRAYFNGLPAVANPLGVAALGGPLPTLLYTILSFVGPLLLFPAALGLLLRLRRARGDERAQIKWVVYAGTITFVLFLAYSLLVQVLHLAPPALEILLLLGIDGSLLALPLAIGIAIFKYRLYAIDVLINRTLVYGALTASVVTLYVLAVVALGALLQTQGNGLIALLATALVAVLFHPLRQRLQRGVNRLLYGQRDEPYAVLSRLGQRLEATLAPEAVLPAIVETVREALKLPYAALSLKQGDAFALTACAGAAGGELVSLPLVYQHDAIGQLLVAPRAPGEPLTPTDQRLLSDLARQAGVAAHAVRLTSDLERMTVDLQRSRERLVTAREEERRRLRRDLHDGLGPTLASMTLKLDAARNLLTQQPAAIGPILCDVSAQLKATIVEIRRLVYDLRPPALDELGLVSALQEQAPQYRQVHGVQVSIEAPPQLPTLPAAVEVAAYRIVLEALTNVARHAQAQSCWVRLTLPEDLTEALTIEVLDDGQGLPSRSPIGVGLASMRERAEELGGTCVISNGATGGVHILVQLPLTKE